MTFDAWKAKSPDDDNDPRLQCELCARWFHGDSLTLWSSPGRTVMSCGECEERSLLATDWKCPARPTADPPEDCNWPLCGCDPYANKVIAALEESGALSKRGPP